MKNYFTTGEFAKLCNVKKQTLFHYDDIEILSPEKVGENGYRYYSYKQLEVFSMISILRDLEMPLGEIKKYIDSRSPQKLIELLNKESLAIEEKIKELHWAKSYIDTKLAITTEGLHVPSTEIFIENRPKEYLIATTYSGSNDEVNVIKAVSEHFYYCHEMDLYSAYSIGGMIPLKGLKESGNYTYSHFYTTIDEEGHKYTHAKEAGDYLTRYSRGYEGLAKVAQGLTLHGEKSGLTLGDFFYEDIILDSLSLKNEKDYLIKLSIKLL